MYRIFALLTALLLTILAASCQRTAPCASASAQDTTADAEEDADDPGCPTGLNCGAYGSYRDPLPVCCRGACQREACK